VIPRNCFASIGGAQESFNLRGKFVALYGKPVGRQSIVNGKPFRAQVGSEVQFALEAKSPCPCGSGKRLWRCCLTAKGLRKPAARTAPHLPQTMIPNERCYAAPLADCVSEISREHYVSKSLLRYINRVGGGMTVSGPRWLKDGPRKLPPDALAANVLCRRHNAALSHLDDIAVRLFKAFDDANAGGSGRQEIYLFNGHDVER